jgi:hypothetical protein
MEGNARHEEYVAVLSVNLFDYEDGGEDDDEEDIILTPEPHILDWKAFHEHDQVPKVDIFGRVLYRWKHARFKDPLKPRINMVKKTKKTPGNRRIPP